MDIYTMTEQAYKNGYEAGVKELAERLKDNYNVIFGRKAVSVADINIAVEEMSQDRRWVKSRELETQF